ncbi:MAG: hypothetical protein AAGD01_20140 [Acidobacteriota bacterium]
MMASGFSRDRRWSPSPPCSLRCLPLLLLLLVVFAPPGAAQQVRENNFNTNEVRPTVIQLAPGQQEAWITDQRLLEISPNTDSIASVGKARRGDVTKLDGYLVYRAPNDLTVRNPDSVSYRTANGIVGQLHVLRRPIGILTVLEDFNDNLIDPAFQYYGPLDLIRFDNDGGGDQGFPDPNDLELLVEGDATMAVGIGFGGTGGGDTSGSRTNFGVDPRDPLHLMAIKVAEARDSNGVLIWSATLPESSGGVDAQINVYDELGQIHRTLPLNGIEPRHGIEVTYWPTTDTNLADGRLIVTGANGTTFNLPHLAVGRRTVDRVLFGVLNPGHLEAAVHLDDIRFEKEVPRPVVLPAFSEGFEDDGFTVWPKTVGTTVRSTTSALAGQRGLEVSANGSLSTGSSVQRMFGNLYSDGFEIRFLLDASMFVPSSGQQFTIMEVQCNAGWCLRIDLFATFNGFEACALSSIRGGKAAAICQPLDAGVNSIAVRRRAGSEYEDSELALSTNDGEWKRHPGTLVAVGGLQQIRMGLWSVKNRGFGALYFDEVEVLR